MTRKRFVKLAMANGYSRNSANRIAEKVPTSGKTYADAYTALLAVKKLWAALVPAMTETVERLTKAFSKVAKALSEGVSAFSKAYSAAMTEE